MAKTDKGIMPQVMRDAISEAQKARWAALRERLALADEYERLTQELEDEEDNDE